MTHEIHYEKCDQCGKQTRYWSKVMNFRGIDGCYCEECCAKLVNYDKNPKEFEEILAVAILDRRYNK